MAPRFPLALEASEHIQELINADFWTAFPSCDEEKLTTTMRYLAYWCPFTMAEFRDGQVNKWVLGRMRKTRTFSTSRSSIQGDVVLCFNLDDEGQPTSGMQIWSPRILHIGLVDEDDIEPINAPLS